MYIPHNLAAQCATKRFLNFEIFDYHKVKNSFNFGLFYLRRLFGGRIKKSPLFFPIASLFMVDT